MITESDLKFIDDFKPDGTGWARFSEDRRFRFRLARAVTPAGVTWIESIKGGQGAFPRVQGWPWGVPVAVKRVVFVMLNPSDADAFKPDRTLDKCVQFAIRWGADVVEIVNLAALITPYPNVLIDTTAKQGAVFEIDGHPSTNMQQVMEACEGATRIIAAWGANASDPAILRYADAVRIALRVYLKVECLGRTNEGFPKHPLARGKSFIPITHEPEEFRP